MMKIKQTHKIIKMINYNKLNKDQTINRIY